MPKKISFDTVREIALKLPEVEDSTLHGIPSLKARDKLLTRRRSAGNGVALRDFEDEDRKSPQATLRIVIE